MSVDKQRSSLTYFFVDLLTSWLDLATDWLLVDWLTSQLTGI